MIRQAISCDICATEKKQTNHWFVAFEQGGELRVSGWNARNRLRPGMKHLCGQTCLHKLVDEFMARTIATRVQPGNAEDTVQPLAADTNASFTSSAAYESPAYLSRPHASRDPVSLEHLSQESAFSDLDEFESSARLITRPVPELPNRPPRQPNARPTPELVAMPARPSAMSVPEPPASVEEPARYSSRNWRAEAWDRERERELRADTSPRRRAGS